MKTDKLQRKFDTAVSYVNNFKGGLPADILLKLYAYYKIANENNDHPGSSISLINAFKTNALIQAKNMNPKQAMSAYVKLASTLEQYS